MKFSMVVHAHQPPDNYDWVFHEALERSYGPFVDLLERLPEVRVSAHFSGSLLEWLERNAADYLARLRALVARGQVEMVTAGLQEPVLTLLSPRDRVHQVLAHRAYLRRLFGTDATFAWLTERVWTPEVVTDLVAAGVEAVALDEGHFVAAGLRREDLVGPFTTEWQGEPLTVMPASDEMRRVIPWETVPRVLREVRRIARHGDQRILAFTDDLEKFGMWPTTYEKVWRRGWMRDFFEGLLESRGVEVVPLQEAVAAEPPGAKVYLPDGSYPEMLEWSMTPRAQRAIAAVRTRLRRDGTWEDAAPFVRAGLYFQFLAKYPEANYFHKRMLDVSTRVARMYRPAEVARQLDDVPEAVRQLWRAQANCPYWHGWFGGTYLPVLRQQVFRALLRAENALEAGGQHPRHLRVFDLDADGVDEALITTEALVATIAPADGGTIVELSSRRAAVNVADTIARYPEAYHDADTPPYEYDTGRRAILVDRFLAPGAPPARRADVRDLGYFAGRPYTMVATARDGVARVALTRDADAPGGSLRIEKTITVPARGSKLRAEYRLTGVSGEVAARFGVESNFGICFPEHPAGRVEVDGTTYDLRRGGAVRGASGYRLVLDDPSVAIRVMPDRVADLDARPLTTVSRSERGLEKNQQALTCLLTWPLYLAVGETFEVAIEIAVDAPGMPA